MNYTKNLGSWGENLVSHYLKSRGYSFLVKNYKYSRLEVDLIFKKNDYYVFVEVKTRLKNSENKYENPLTGRQTKNLQKAIFNYCFKNSLNPEKTQLDLIVITINKEAKKTNLKHYPNILV